MRIKTITAAALGLALTPTHAEMVAQHIAAISKRTAIMYQLSDTKCDDGSYRVLVSTTDTYNFPRAFMYGDGCWTLSRGTVHIVGKSFDEGIPINISYDANLFKDGNEKVDWSRFYRAPKSEQPTDKVKAMISRVDKLALQCRDEKTTSACDQFGDAVAQVYKQGWCWGPEDAIGADKHWIRCQ